MLLGLGVGSIFALFILSISSQSTPRTNSKQCYPLNSRRFLSCPPGYEARSLSTPPPPPNILERRLFIRKLRNPSIPSDSVLCCRVGNSLAEEETDAEKLSSSSPQLQFPNGVKKRRRRPRPQKLEPEVESENGGRKRRRRRRKKPRNRFHAIINKLGESVDQILTNTSLTYIQHDGWTWTFRPFKVFSPFGEEKVFEKYRTRRGRNFRRNNNLTPESPLREPPTVSTTKQPPPPSTTQSDPEFEEDFREFSPSSLPPPPLPTFQRPLPKSSPLIEAQFTASPRSQPPPPPPQRPTLKSSPYLLSILRNGVHFCSGVVLDSKHILTAANCFVSNVPGTESQEMVVNVDPSGVTVRVGKVEDGTGSEFELEHICVHNTVPNPSKELNEVAVLTLQKALVFTADFFPARPLWEEKGALLTNGNNYASWFASSENMDSAPTKQVASRVCTKRHRFFMRKDEFCLQLGGMRGKSCSRSDFLGGALECASGSGSGGRTQVCGIITETSCPPLQQGEGIIRRRRRNPVTKVSPIPKWIYPILSSNSYRNCF